MSEPLDFDERAIAHALHSDDAASPEPFDDALVADYEEVLARLHSTDRQPPADLEDRVVDAALAARPAAIRSLDATRRRRRTEHPGRRRLAIVATAAAIAGGAAVVSLGQDDGGAGTAAELVGEATPAELDALLDDPTSRQLELRDTNGTPVASIVLGQPDETGRTEAFLYDVALPPAPAEHTYWLWVITRDGPVAVGDIGPSPTPEHFQVTGEVDGASVSVEAETGEPSTPGTTVASS